FNGSWDDVLRTLSCNEDQMNSRSEINIALTRAFGRQLWHSHEQRPGRVYKFFVLLNRRNDITAARFEAASTAFPEFYSCVDRDGRTVSAGNASTCEKADYENFAGRRRS